MRDLVRVFGDRPQVRLLQACLALAPYRFTRAELASEAGLRRSSANRVFPILESLKLVRQVTDGSQPVYEVVGESRLFALLQVLEPALAMAIRSDDGLEAALDAPGLFAERARAISDGRILVKAVVSEDSGGADLTRTAGVGRTVSQTSESWMVTA